MSSTTSAVPSVAYHLSNKLDQNCSESINADSLLSGKSKTDSGGTLSLQYPGTSIPKVVGENRESSKNAVANLDSALCSSLKPWIRGANYYPSENGCISDHLPKNIHRSLAFHESSAPPLDSVIRQRIETLPRHLILTDSDKNHSKAVDGVKLLCTNSELECLCRTGDQYVPRHALGLGNAGNTCYLNSVIQCLLATGPLLAYVSTKHTNSNTCLVASGQAVKLHSGPNKSRFCGLCGLSRLLKEHTQRPQSNGGMRFDFSGGGSQTMPSYFVSNVRAVCPSLRPYQQEDAHEFLLGLLSRMEDSVMAGLGKLPRAVTETNVIRRIFGGVVRSEVTCHSCRKVSARDEQCFNLSVDIIHARSLQQCLFNYIRNEELCGQNAYKCENCRQLRPAVRRCTILQGPPVLVIQFNRFSRHQKLDTRIEFPSWFNLRPFMSENKGPTVLYRLYATVNHEGYSCRSGHYIAFSRRNNTWLTHNDSFVNSTSLDHVLRQTPYLLFYEAVNPVAKSSPQPKQPSSNVLSKPVATNVQLPARNNLICNGSPHKVTPTVPVSDIPLPSPSTTRIVSPNKLPTLVRDTTATNTPRIVFNPAFSKTFLAATTKPTLVKTPTTPSTSSTAGTLPMHTKISTVVPPAVQEVLFGRTDSPGTWSERVPTSTPWKPRDSHTATNQKDAIVSPTIQSGCKREHSPTLSEVPAKMRSPAKSTSDRPSISSSSYRSSNGKRTPSVSNHWSTRTSNSSDSDASVDWVPVTKDDLSRSHDKAKQKHGRPRQQLHHSGSHSVSSPVTSTHNHHHHDYRHPDHHHKKQQQYHHRDADGRHHHHHNRHRGNHRDRHYGKFDHRSNFAHR